MYVNKTIYCSGSECSKPLIRYNDKGHLSHVNGSRIVSGERLCIKCADDVENAKEMGYRGYQPQRLPFTMRQKDEEAWPMEAWKALPIATDEEGDRYQQGTFLTELGQARVIDPEWAVNIVIGHALATADVNRWLDTLNNPNAHQVDKERARLLLSQSAEEFKWMCEKRALVADKVQAPAVGGIKITWKAGL